MLLDVTTAIHDIYNREDYISLLHILLSIWYSLTHHGEIKMNKKIIGILICMLFLISAFSTPINSEMFSMNDPPYTPSNPDPTNESIDVDVTAILSWTGGDPDGDPVVYDIYFGTDPIPPDVTDCNLNTTYDPGRLNYNTQYYWRIDAWDNHGFSTTGPVWTFHTVYNVPPYLPSNPNPANGSTSVDVNTCLSWIGGDPYGDPVVYDIYFGTDSNPPIVTNLSSTTYDPGRLNYNTQYYWRIDAWDNHGFSTTGPVWTFCTAENNPPYLPSNPNPANGSTGVDVDTALSWTGGDPDIGDTVVYDVYLGTDSNPPNVATGHSSTTYDPGKLNSSTQYYWRIDAWDNKGYSTTGPTWTFETVISTNDPPDKPSRPTGTSPGKIHRSYSYSSSTIDSDGDQIFYKFDWDDGTNSGWVGPYNSGETLYLSHVWSTSGSYNIKVKAKDEHGAESVWSDPLPIRMPKNKQPINLLQQFLVRLIERFPLLEYLLDFR
jgi:hypothetical protein